MTVKTIYTFRSRYSFDPDAFWGWETRCRNGMGGLAVYEAVYQQVFFFVWRLTVYPAASSLRDAWLQFTSKFFVCGVAVYT